MSRELKQGDYFYITRKPKNKKYNHLYGKPLIVGIAWMDGSITPTNEGVVIPANVISSSPSEYVPKPCRCCCCHNNYE